MSQKAVHSITEVQELPTQESQGNRLIKCIIGWVGRISPVTQ